MLVQSIQQVAPHRAKFAFGPYSSIECSYVDTVVAACYHIAMIESSCCVACCVAGLRCVAAIFTSLRCRHESCQSGCFALTCSGGFGALCQGPSRDNSVIQIGCATRSIFLALCPAQRVVAILTNCTAIHEWICTRGNPEPFHVRRKKASPVMKAFHCFFFCSGQALCGQATAPLSQPF